MKGVVRPQAMPTRRKPSVRRRIEGCGGGVVVVGSIFGGVCREGCERGDGTEEDETLGERDDCIVVLMVRLRS